ncbi:at hook motif family protein [Stylonychia lemnae]|uniref:At hook motif family protein n=1 Tax=Stylonychia lemnae TaxID=5949 RepID=A0A078B3V6_STYLE|nr:at hook motif family protein [Stylonychia lemnae]|eukprot:CDW89230.1 at hook motif family protein [Stylonychia lemnae]
MEDSLQNVKSVHVKALIQIMHRYFKYFKHSFLNLLDRIICLDEKDSMIKGVYKLLEKFYSEMSKNQQLSKVDVNSLMTSVIEQLVTIYGMTKINSQIQYRAAFMLTQICNNFGLVENDRLNLPQDLKLSLIEATIDMLHSSRSTIQIYGVQLCANMANQNRPNDQLFMNLMNVMTHNKLRDVRKAALHHLQSPFSEVALLFLGKRLRDKDDDVRKLAFQKLRKNGIQIEHFKSKEQIMLIMKEGLTDNNENVREQCIEFLKPSLFNEDGTLQDLSHLFKIIDCKKMFVKEYYMQLPFIIMRFIFHCLGEEEVKLCQYLEQILKRLRDLAGISQNQQDHDMNHEIVLFEEILFLRIAFEFTKMYKKDRQQEYLERIDEIQVDFEQYQKIFFYLLKNPPMIKVQNPDMKSDLSKNDDLQKELMMPDRLVFSEWLKFSLQLSIEDEITRRNLVSLMFNYIGKTRYSYLDYQYFLRHSRFILKDSDEEMSFGLQQSSDNSSDYEADFDEINEQQNQEEQIIQIEIRAFGDLNMQKDILEYCKPFSFESLVVDSDDVCRIAVMVARKLLDQRIDEFSLSMLQAISDIKEPLEENSEDGSFNFKKQKEQVYSKLESKLESVNELIMQDDYSIQDLNVLMRKVKGYVNLIEEINLKEKLSYKRALNMCLILLKQCRADVNDQNLISICDTLIAPTISSKDKDNMILAIECIGLLCLLDKELFENYSKIFQRILVEDIMEENLRDKIIALKSSVDSLIIHGVNQKTQKLQKIIVEDYMVIKDKILRQITIEGICKMLFSRKLTLNTDNEEMEFLLSQLIIQWFDKKFNWQNSLVRQILNTFFKSFVLFSQQRCEIMLRACMKIIFSIMESKYNEIKKIKNVKKKSANQTQIQKPKNNKKRLFECDDDDDDESEDFSVDEEDFYSDDSRCGSQQALMQNIVKELDPIQITKIFMLLLSRDYINQNAAKEFKLNKDLNIDFLLQICYLNAEVLKKVAIVKEFINQVLDYVDVNKCSNWKQLEILGRYIEINANMLIQGNLKLKKLKEVIDKKVAQLQKDEAEYDHLLDGGAEDYKVQMLENLKQLTADLSEYYEKEIFDTVVDLVVDDDQEYQEINSLQVQGLDRSMYSPYALKNNRMSNVSESMNQDTTNQRVLRRRSGLRSNSKTKENQYNNSVPLANKKLRAIPEVEEIKDISSSEKPKMTAKLCETILEEKDITQDNIVDKDFNENEDEYMSSSSGFKNEINERIKHDQRYIEERQHRHGVMARISKKMARDFEYNKKKSIQSNSASSCTQINEQRMKEEYHDGRTVFKISKHKSISPINNNQKGRDNQQNFQASNQGLQFNKELNELLQEGNEVAHNLSVRFENIQSSDLKDPDTNRKEVYSMDDQNDYDSRLNISSIKKEVKKVQKKSQSRNRKGIKKDQISQKQAQQQQQSQVQSRSFVMNENAFKPQIKAPVVQPIITRRMMKSISSQSMNHNSSKNQDSNDENESDSSGSNVFAFMESDLTKKKKEALARQRVQGAMNKSDNNLRVPHQQMKGKSIGKRTQKDYDEDEMDGYKDSNHNSFRLDRSKENIKPTNRPAQGQKKGSVRNKK